MTLYFLSGGPCLTGSATGSCNKTRCEYDKEDFYITVKNMALNLTKDLIYQNSLAFCKIFVRDGEFILLSLFLFRPTLQSIVIANQCSFLNNLEKRG